MIDPSIEYRAQTADRFASMIEGTIDERVFMTPAQWAETDRTLPQQTSPQPGPFSFDATPYWREVVDCFDPDSPIHFCAVQKGAQVGATVAVLENIIGYEIGYVKTSPIIFATADLEVAQARMDTNVIPMINDSNLGHLLQSNDIGNNKKQGKTSKKLEWAGGGYMLPFGANSATKMRSFSVPILLRDEVSGWPLVVGKDGDPMELTETRTNSYEKVRKILDLSTPTIAGTDVISKRFELGDQRYYFVPCKHCGEMQRLYFNGNAKEKGQGRLMWETEGGVLVPDSVQYVCPFCGGTMINEDKMIIMPEGEWRPTATPSAPDFRSYHVSAMYAPHFARTWSGIVQSWLKAWDTEANIPKDADKLQVFYNNDLGMPYELKTDKVKLNDVSSHRRAEYNVGEIPNKHALQNAGGAIEIITMAVDVQKAYLSVAVMGWAPSADNAGYAAYIIDYFRITGDCESADAGPWIELADIIDHRRYTEGGRDYPVAVTMVDASYLTDTVYSFCSQWESSVLPLRGRDKPIKGGRIKEFDILENATGTSYVAVTVDLYKDRWSPALRRMWNGVDRMPRNNLSVPGNVANEALKELTVEYKREKRDPQSNKLLGTYWHRPGGSRQEMWDLLMYNTAAVEMAALQVCIDAQGVEALVWPMFWESCPGVFWEVAHKD